MELVTKKLLANTYYVYISTYKRTVGVITLRMRL